MPGRNGETNQLYNPHWFYRTPATVQYPETWTYNKPIFDRVEMLNGLKWRHFMFWEYSTLSSDPDMPALSVASKESGSRGSAALLYPVPVIPVSQPDALILVGEVYEHAVDDNHKMLVYGHIRSSSSAGCALACRSQSHPEETVHADINLSRDFAANA